MLRLNQTISLKSCGRGFNPLNPTILDAKTKTKLPQKCWIGVDPLPLYDNFRKKAAFISGSQFLVQLLAVQWLRNSCIQCQADEVQNGK